MDSKNYVLALDQGTTSSRAIIFNHSGIIKSIVQKEFKQYYPQPGWVEHDPNEIWISQLEAVKESITMAGISPANIISVGITNQRETTILWDNETGKPVYNAIVWQDRRTAGLCNSLNDHGMGAMISEKTGLVIDPYFSATKVNWILDHVEGVRKKADKGRICFGTVDSWLLWNLTRGKAFATDVSNASRTMLFNIHTLEWDDELLNLFNIPRSILPQVKSSSGHFADISQAIIGHRIPVTGIAGDQQAALFGQLCHQRGMAKNTYGTGCFVVLNTGDIPVVSNNKLLTTIAWQIGNKTIYALEGSIFIAGAVIQWLRDGLGIIASARESEILATSISDNEGVYFVPAFTGLGSPHWDPYARGSIFGITRGTTRAHFCRAALESIAYQVYDTISSMIKDSGQLIRELRVDGGAVHNDFLMQFQADILGKQVVRPKVMETTALGAAYLSGLAVGFWNDEDEIRKQWEAERIFNPKITRKEADQLLINWNKALSRSKNWVE